jgi:ankyrin repeat protein
MVTTLIEKMHANIHTKMHNNLSTMHCAAQTYGGFLSILMLHDRYQVEVNQLDAKMATPLHFAVLQCECKNVELLIKLGANLDA